MSVNTLIPTLLTVAWLLPLLGFAIEIFAGWWQPNRQSKAAAAMAVFCIATAFVLSATSLVLYGDHTDWAFFSSDHSEHHAEGHEAEEKDAAASSHNGDHGDHAEPWVLAGRFYTLARFGELDVELSYYIDSLTILMFVMVTLIASCIHVFAMGYMSDELTDDHVDHEVHLSDGSHLHRPGRFYRFFAYMSLFCFSMLGLVIAGNIFQVFVFWELVGICSYLLIGFYVERHSASTAANKAFIVNRVGDFGFLIGLMILWTYCGTFSFQGYESKAGDETVYKPGLFELIRDDHGQLNVEETKSNRWMVHLEPHEHSSEHQIAESHAPVIPYWLLVAAGLGVFAGCVGKSAQFPLQTWLPDAMEGPTPVSALVHSATMVAAGVYLAGRFFPTFAPEVLLAIAYVGCITLFIAATIAVVATDIKRVLAYSTISQLGYMMLAIGVGGWAAGLFHLITHAFFKSLMFLASGSVIVACHHEQEMPKMGGLWRKLPITAFTMLVGVIAICGLAIPGISIFGEKIAFSGYHSKDAIVATGMAFMYQNPIHGLLFFVPLITAGITAFYMFRLWFYTFACKPRDQHIYDHAQESPAVMTGPLIVLSLFAAFCALGGEEGPLFGLLLQSEPSYLADGLEPIAPAVTALPSHDAVHKVHSVAGLYALLVACLGAVAAYVLYGTSIINPGEIKRQFSGLHTFLVEKWWFDELYDAMFVRPVHVVSAGAAWFDRTIIDGLLHFLSRFTVYLANWDRRFDEGVIDGFVNLLGNVVFSFGRSLRVIQTGMLRQYIMFIAVGVIVLFVLLFTFLPK